MGLNRWIGMGRITAPLELKQTPTGKSVCSFTIAIDRGVSDATDFIDIVAWEKTAEFICKYFGKGKMICVEGSIQSRSYTTGEGQKRSVKEVNAERVHFTGEKKEAGSESNFDDITEDGFGVVDYKGEDDDLPF